MILLLLSLEHQTKRKNYPFSLSLLLYKSGFVGPAPAKICCHNSERAVPISLSRSAHGRVILGSSSISAGSIRRLNPGSGLCKTWFMQLNKRSGIIPSSTHQSKRGRLRTIADLQLFSWNFANQAPIRSPTCC